MKALFIGSYPNTVEPYRSIFFRELIYQFADLGVDCTVISCSSLTYYRQNINKIIKYQQERTLNGNIIDVYRPNIITYSAQKIWKWNTIHLTQKSIERAVWHQVFKLNTKFDFIYGHFFLGGGLIAAKIAKKLKIPAYIAYGECNFETEVRNKYGDIQKEELDSVKGIIAVSSANRTDLLVRKITKEIPIFLSINAVDPTSFYIKDQTLCREKFNISKDDLVVGFVGYFIDRKGPNRILTACNEIDGIKLAFAGKGPLQLVDEKIVFCQSLPHEDIVDFMNAIDIFVLPTLHEGCSNAIIEAMACKKAIISSDLPFNHDILNKNNSILVNPNSIFEITEAIKLLKNNKKIRLSIAEKAFQDSKELTLKNRAKNILEFITKTSVGN